MQSIKNSIFFFNYFSSSSKTLFGRNCSIAPRVIQYGTANANKNTSNQNAIPPNKRNNTMPKILILLYFCNSLIRNRSGKINK